MLKVSFYGVLTHLKRFCGLKTRKMMKIDFLGKFWKNGLKMKNDEKNENLLKKL